MPRLGHEAAAIAARRIAQAFASPFSVQGQNIRVTASVGLAVAPENGVTADELMRHADIALYEAKNQGRDRAVMFSAEMAERVEHRRSIELELRNALEANAAAPPLPADHFVPTGRDCRRGGASALGVILSMARCRRWSSFPSPKTPVFFPRSENGSLNSAMTDSKHWPELEVAVNLSPVQFRHVDLRATLRKLVAKHDVTPDRFVLEITENVLLEATDHTNSVLDVIRAMGFKTALDDFGTRLFELLVSLQFQVR